MRNSQCYAPNCKRNVLATGLCQKHYDRKRRYGDLQDRPLTKICEDCGVEFVLFPSGNIPPGCDACMVDRHRRRQRADRRRKGLWEYYKITLDEYDAMHKAQNGLCYICGQKQIGRGAKNNQLCVDHNHETGNIRGLLCTNCNLGLGNFQDSIALLQKAIVYLQERDN